MEAYLDQVFTVDRIMTPTAKLAAWPVDGDPVALWRNDALRRFDLVPASDAKRIGAVWVRAEQEPRQLTRDWLLSQGTPIAELLDLFADSGRAGFFVIYGQSIQGLVTPADLNKLPVRAFLYSLIGDLEMNLGALVAEMFDNDLDRLLESVSGKRREYLEKELQVMEEGNADIDVVELLYLSDLISIIGKNEALRSPLGYTSRSAVKDDLGGLNELRNDIMHPVRPMLEKVPEDLETLRDRVRRARDVLVKIEEVIAVGNQKRAGLAASTNKHG